MAVLALGWAGPAPAQAPCPVVEGPVRACPPPAGWRALALDAGAADAGAPTVGIEAVAPSAPAPAARDDAPDLAYLAAPGLTAELIVRPIGRDAGNDGEVMRRHVLEVAVERSGLAQREVAVLAEEPAGIDGREAATLVHRLGEGAAVVADTFLVGPDFALEAVTREEGASAYTDTHREAHAALLAMIRLGGAS